MQRMSERMKLSAGLKRLGFALLAGIISLGLTLGVVGGSADAQGTPALPPLSTYQAMLRVNKPSGWVQFRNYNGRQLIYFSALQTMHCRLAEIRYSINSDDLDQRFALVPCNPALPFSLPPKSGLEDVAIELLQGTADAVAVQVVWEDGSKSEVAIYQPCLNVGDQTCAVPVQ